MKRFTKKLIAFLGIFAVLLLTFDLLRRRDFAVCLPR